MKQVETTTIGAELELSPDGEPVTETIRGTRYYKLRLFLENAPPDAYAVTYELHESYYDRVREVRKGPDFSETVFTYGDYDVQAYVRTRSGVRPLVVNLSAALRRTHPRPAPAVARALKEIAEN